MVRLVVVAHTLSAVAWTDGVIDGGFKTSCLKQILPYFVSVVRRSCSSYKDCKSERGGKDVSFCDKKVKSGVERFLASGSNRLEAFYSHNLCL